MSNRRRQSGNSDNFIFLSSKTTVDGECSRKIKRRLLLGRKAMTNLDSLSETSETSTETKQRHYFANKGPVKAMVFPVVMYGCESWTVKKAEH